MQIQVLSLAIGVALPIIVGIITTKITSSATKAVLLALLSAASGFGTELLNHPHGYDWKTAALTWLATFIVAVASHFGFFKPVGASQWVQANIGRTTTPTSVAAHAAGNTR